MSERSILFIGADSSAATRVQASVQDAFGNDLQWVSVQTLFDGLRFLQERSFDVILADFFVPDGHGLGMLRQLRQHAAHTSVIALCHAQDRDTGVNAVRKGAFDFFCYEDFDAANLAKSIEDAMNRALVDAETKAAADRRNSARFPCRMAVTYQSLEHPILCGKGISETVNISSKGLLFTSTESFHAGQLVQVSLDWPARLENQIPLKLVAEGRIVRNSQGQTAMTIEKYEFRTRRTPAKATSAGDQAKPGPAAVRSIVPAGAAMLGRVRSSQNGARSDRM